ncbi:hypothetical protein D3C78_1387630 [compost metagenome]
MNTQDFKAGTGQSGINLVQNENENLARKRWNNVLPPETEKPLMTDYFTFEADSQDMQEHPVFTVEKAPEGKTKIEEKGGDQ